MALFRSRAADSAGFRVRSRTDTRDGESARPMQRSMLASAVLVKQSQLRAIPEQRDWQTQAWDFYDRINLLRFAAQWMSNALSRCRLYVGVPDDDGAGEPDPVTDDADSPGHVQARVPLEELFGGPAGHPEMLARLAIHLTIPGESYIVGIDDADTGQRRWIVASGEEFTKRQQQVKIRLPDSNEQVPIDLEKATVIRCWRPHARKAWEADSPVRALLGDLQELADLRSYVKAILESRMAGRGILFMSESTVLPTPANQPAGTPLHEDPAMATLIDAMVTPITNRDSASAVVPILARQPDAAKDPHFMDFATKLDEQIQPMREAAIRRIAAGLDMPAEVLLGMGEANHWTAWQLEESAVKLHIEPLLGLICDSLTERYLHPALEAMGVAEPEKYVIWFDASELVLRPNRAPEAQNLYNLGLLAGDPVRRAAGFTTDDEPDDDEAQRYLLTQLALKGIKPDDVRPYLELLGIDLPEAVTPAPAPEREADAGEDGEPGTAGPGGEPTDQQPDSDQPSPPHTPGDPDNPDRPAEPDATTASITELGRWPLAAVEMGVLRALEMVGKRLLNWGGRAWRGRIHCDPWEIHTRIPACDFDTERLLDGAFSSLEQVLDDQPCIRRAVDGYVRSLLADQKRHDRASLFRVLYRAGCFEGGGDVHAA